jgi:hypothetical protein
MEITPDNTQNRFDRIRSAINIKLLPCIHAMSLLDFVPPGYVGEIIEMADAAHLNPDFEKRLTYHLNTADSGSILENRIVFVLGGWGTGKTFQLLCYRRKKAREGVNIGYCSFWGIDSVEEALFHTIPPWYRLCTSLFLLFIAAIAATFMIVLGQYALGFMPAAIQHVWSPELLTDGFALVVPITVTIWLIPSKWKILYTIAAWLCAPITSTRTIILDDLERSGLSSEDQWRFLLCLWKHHVQYIIPVGGRMGKSAADWHDTVHKINAQIVALPAANAFTRGLMERNSLSIPFNSMPWLTSLTPRDIAAVLERFNEFSANISAQDFRNILIINLIVHKLLDKHGVPQEHREANKIRLMDGIINISSVNAFFTHPQRAQIESIIHEVFRDIEPEFLARMTQCPNPEQNNSIRFLEFLLARPEHLVKRLEEQQRAVNARKNHIGQEPAD